MVRKNKLLTKLYDFITIHTKVDKRKVTKKDKKYQKTLDRYTQNMIK